MLDPMPELQVLPDFLDAHGALDVLCLVVGEEAISDGLELAAAFGDARVQQGCDLADGTPTNPPILLEKGLRPIPNQHNGGGEEERMFLGAELQVQASPGPGVVSAAEPESSRAEREAGACKIADA